MKTKKEIFETLECILTCYDSYRINLDLSEEQAQQKTLDTYSDFYEWLNEEK